MPIVQWSDQFKTGVCGVDCQHKALLKMLGGLDAIIEKSQDRDVVSEAAGWYADFVVEHFQCEEKMMRENGYAAYESHKELHDGFAAHVNEAVHRFNESGDSQALADSIRTYMVPWLTEHFSTTDREMASVIAGGPNDRAA